MISMFENLIGTLTFSRLISSISRDSTAILKVKYKPEVEFPWFSKEYNLYRNR